VELIKRMVDAGRFGRIHFAEGEYLHDTRDLRAEADGAKTWRGRPELRGGLHCTHSLGPILYISGDRVATVACMEPAGGVGGPIMLMQSVQGAMFKVRLDGNSPRPHNMAYYSVQGDRGAYESRRGLNDAPKIWLDDAHEPSRASAKDGTPIAQWHPLQDFAEEYIPDRLHGPDAAHQSGHFGADYWMLDAFARALLDGRPSPIDVYAALDYAVPGIIAMHSKANGGAPLPVPDFRPKLLPDA
jgi:predicted dehydrogenase